MAHDDPKEFVIYGGRVIRPAEKISQILNVFVKDGRILEISRRTPSHETKKINAAGLCVAHGFIDLHTHLREPGAEYKEDIRSGGKAAAAGGFTTILCMPNTKPVNDCGAITKLIKEKARSVSPVSVLPVGAMTVGLEGKKVADFVEMAKEGVVAVSDDGRCVQDENVMRDVLKTAAKSKLLAISHPEDLSISGSGIMNAGEISKRLGLHGIPREAENNIIERDIRLAEETGARLHIAHVSTKEGIALVRKAKKRGLHVTCEATPHHLLLTEDIVQKLGANAKMNPPLRTEKDRQELLKALEDGTIDAIATDHAPHSEDEKKNILGGAFGVIGMETAFAVCMHLVGTGIITLKKLTELLTIGPAKVIGIDATLNAGSAADMVLFDPAAGHMIDARLFKSKSRNTPFDGWKVRGKVVSTIAGGKVVYEKG